MDYTILAVIGAFVTWTAIVAQWTAMQVRGTIRDTRGFNKPS